MAMLFQPMKLTKTETGSKMKVDIETLQDTFKFAYDTYEESRTEASIVYDLYHNRQYTDDQLTTLENRGQPTETFNIIKTFGRMLLGYYSTVVNSVKIDPIKEDSEITAAVLNDVVNYVFRDNNFNSEGDKLKLDMMIAGYMVSYVDVQETGEYDEFGRPKYKIKINHVPALEVLPDPMSSLDDYSDARFTHRYKWYSEDSVIKQFGAAKIKELDAYDNHLDINESEFSYSYNGEFVGRYKRYDNYLIVHTVIEDDTGKIWSVFWSGDVTLRKKEITYKEVSNPYRLFKLHSSNKAEHYGIFREVIQTQHAINQALIKIQLMVNTQKAFVEKTALDNNDVDAFTTMLNKVNAVIPVKSLSGIKIETLSKEVLDQYTIIDKALDRVQRVLSINDSFLGMAYASDSGSKVKLQQNASVLALRYLTLKVEQFYRLLGWDVMNLAKQYFTAHDVVRVADSYEGHRWVEINRPLQLQTGRVTQEGIPETRMVFEEVLDPASRKPLVSETGMLVMAPVPSMDTEIAFTKAEVSVSSVAYNDEDEKNQQVLEGFINGPLGVMLGQVNLPGYLKAGALLVKSSRTKFSPELADILTQTSQMLQSTEQPMPQNPMSPQQAMNQLPNRPKTGRE